MDDIFEQMLSTSPWGDGIGVNRQASAYDHAMATGSASNMAIDSSVELQAIHKASSMAMGGGLASQGVSTRAMQEGNVPLTPIFDTGQGQYMHGLPVPHHLQPMAPTNWYIDTGVPPTHDLSSRKPDAFPMQGDVMSQDSHYDHGKRPRDEDSLSLMDDLSRNMAHVSASDGMKLNQSFGDQGTVGQDPATGAVKPRVRARRGQATDPHSIAERNRRERIAERMKALQELVPDSNKTDKASMLDEIIGYVKFLQMQVKCLSMCRLGGAGAATPLLGDLPGRDGASNFLAANQLGQLGISGGAPPAGTSQEGMAFAEKQVARLMDEDMSAAMQYLQSKGLCLMPISLATAISSTGARQPQATLEPEGAGNMKQAMELQAAAMAAAAAAAAVGGSTVASTALGCSPRSQDGGSSKLMHANVARSLMPDLQRDDKSRGAEKAPLPPSTLNRNK